jgi:hypothetical protein
MRLTGLFLHGFGVRYDLPISLPLYLGAAGAVVLLSFVLVAVFAGDRKGALAIRYPTREVRFLRGLSVSRWPRVAAGAFGVLFLATIVGTGLFGSPSPDKNPAEYLLWIYFWAGLVVLTGLIGPIWDAVNPFAALDSFISRAWRRPPPAAREEEEDRLRNVGIWPSVFLYFSFACLELTSGYSNRPWLIASLTLVYTVFTLIGMRVYGARSWLAHCEVFTVLFSIFARFGPMAVREGRFYIRPWGAGLLEPWPAGWDRIVFVILTLSSLAFDGIQATPLWASGIVVALSPLYVALGQQWGHVVLFTFGFLDLTALFLVVFFAFMRLVIIFGRTSVNALQTTTAFALTLVPIAYVYNLAHNYSYLVIQGQGLYPLLADPFGKGWHLFNAAGFEPSFLLAGAATVWYAQVILIVVGHIIAVVLAHLRAGERFETARNVLISQYPMLVLMVLYTMTSIWILAQPITEGG